MKILLPIAWIFQLLVMLRNWCFDRGFFSTFKLPGQVISIGNIALGGTGKSPIVTAYAKHAVLQGHRPAILTRGYKSGLRAHEWRVYVDGLIVLGQNDESLVADEAVMQSLAIKGVPVVVGAERSAAAREFIKSSIGAAIDYWILDDGFQHRRIDRDRDVVLLDARQPFGDVLPAGRFREPIQALRRAHEIVVTKAESQAQIDQVLVALQRLRLQAQIKIVDFVPSDILLVHGPKDCKEINPEISNELTQWCAIAGIAQPEDFLRDLKRSKIDPVVFIKLQDHQSLDLTQVHGLNTKIDSIVTTEKDWSRDRKKLQSLNIPIYVLPLIPIERPPLPK